MRLTFIVLLFVALAGLQGCGGAYVLEGKAVAGDYSGLWLVDSSDSRLHDPALAGVNITVKRDPQSLGGKVVASGASAGDGTIRITIDEFGAGWMEEQWEIRASRAEYISTGTLIELPSRKSGKVLLVVLAPGYEPYAPGQESLHEQYERFR